jgi:hypothetical protein
MSQGTTISSTSTGAASSTTDFNQIVTAKITIDSITDGQYTNDLYPVVVDNDGNVVTEG